jgi:hypothetical protein
MKNKNKTTIEEEDSNEAKEEKKYQPAPSPEGKPRLKRVDDDNNDV